jgi:hypothetical protein
LVQKIEVQLVDDLDGTSAIATVRFGLDGKTYEIDLNEKNEAKLRKALTPFMEKGRYVKPTRKRVAK